MILLNQKSSKSILLISTVFLLFSCANTKLSQSWVEPDNKKSYSDFLIIGIGESQQTRRAYESYFVEELAANSTEAVESYKLIKSSEKIEREVVQKAIKGMTIDGVIITHMVAVDEETSYRQGTGYASAGYGRHGRGMYSYYPRVNSYVHSPGYYTTHKTYSLETSLYDIETEELVWTARSSTFSPESVDEELTHKMREAYAAVRDAAEKDNIDMRTTAFVLGIVRVGKAATSRAYVPEKINL